MARMKTETDDYAAKMRKWRSSGASENIKPRANQQVGTHIDTLPVEVNPPMKANIVTSEVKSH
jgi:hypothetical protein